MIRRKYTKPEIGEYKIDKEMSLILMSYNDENNPPDDPFGAAAQSSPSAPSATQESSALEQNPFEENNLK